MKIISNTNTHVVKTNRNPRSTPALSCPTNPSLERSVSILEESIPREGERERERERGEKR
jgi:hypothetical protein